MPNCFICKKRNASFRFPSDRTTRLKWMNVLDMETVIFPDKNDRICEDHFDPSDFNCDKKGKRGLKPGVLPKYFVCTKPVSTPISVIVDSTKEGFSRSIVIAVGTLLICFWSCLLLWLSTSDESKDQPGPKQVFLNKKVKVQEKFTPVSIDNTGLLLQGKLFLSH